MNVKSPKRGILLGICTVVLSLLLIAGYTTPVLADIEPVLDLGENGEWDDTLVSSGWVIKDGATYKMWYTGGNGAKNRIGYATSPDGINWDKYEGNPVLEVGASGQWDQTHACVPCVIKDGATYKMWYSGKSGGYWKIGYATSSDGISWTKSSANPVLDVGAGGTWEDCHVYQPCVIKDDTEPTNKYKMWYSASDATTIRIGYATSPDGINWDKYEGNPVLDLGTDGQWDDYHACTPNVIKEDGTYKMWYTGYDGTTARIGYATSSDGTNWNKHADNPVFSESSAGNFDESEVQNPCVILESSYKMWYRGDDSSDTRRIGYAISDDGIAWTRVSGPSPEEGGEVITDSKPTVDIKEPSSGDTVQGTVTISAFADDSDGIDKVEFYIDSSLKYTETTLDTTYEYEWDSTAVSNGDHTIEVKAYDMKGYTNTDSITVTVDNSALVEIKSISCPDEVETDQPFNIVVTIENKGYKDTEDVTVIIDLPSDFSLTSGSTIKSLGTITAGESKTTSWNAKASEPGDFSIAVHVSSANGGSDSLTDTIHVGQSFVYTMTKTTYAGLPPFVWIVLVFAGIGIGFGVVLKKRVPAEKPKDVPLIAPSEVLSIKRGYETAGQYVKVGIKVENISPTTITDVSVKIDVPSALEKVNPKTGIVELGVIKNGCSQSANFQLTPTRCVDDYINAIIMFRDATGKMYTQEMKPLELRSVCPMLTGEDVDQEWILMALRKGKLQKSKASFKFKGDPRTAFIMAEARIRGLIPLDKDEKFMEDTYVACGCYIGRTKYGEFDFATELIVSGKQNEGLLTITVYSNEEAILSGFFYEVLQDVKKHIEITRETIDVVDQACPECSGQLNFSKADEERYLKCEFCETLLRLPPWKK